MTLLDEQRRGDRRVDAAGHRGQDSHRCKTAERERTFSTMRGSAALTASTSWAVLSLPNENRSAATPARAGRPSPSARATARPSQCCTRSRTSRRCREVEVHQQRFAVRPGIDAFVMWVRVCPANR